MSTGEDDGGYSAALEAHIESCDACRALERYELEYCDPLQQACFQAEQDNLQAAHEARLDDEADRTNDERWADRKAEQ